MLSLNVLSKKIDQSFTIEEIAKHPPRTWEKVFESSVNELKDISMILDQQEKMYGQYYPLKEDIFAAFNFTPLPLVKVVIIGQDPYHQTVVIDGKTVPRAIGRSFSVRKEDTIPSSLNNIYTELANTVSGFVKPDHGYLREWEQQGVLLLNSCLTVRPGLPESHGDIWLGFINRVFKAIIAVNPKCIFMLWGRKAQALGPLIGDNAIILQAAHPSGFSARKGFFGCNHFNQANQILISVGKTPINWKISSLNEINENNKMVVKLPIVLPNKFVTVDPNNLTCVNSVKNNNNQEAKQYKPPSPPIPVLPTIPNTKSNSPEVEKEPSSPAPILNNINTPMIPQINFFSNTPPPITIKSP